MIKEYYYTKEQYEKRNKDHKNILGTDLTCDFNDSGKILHCRIEKPFMNRSEILRGSDALDALNRVLDPYSIDRIIDVTKDEKDGIIIKKELGFKTFRGY